MKEPKLKELLLAGYDIHITCDARRCEKDTTGELLPDGREFYGLYNYKFEKGNEIYYNQWPGFYDVDDLINDINKFEL